MQVECHQLDRKYQELRVRRRREEASLAVRMRMGGQDGPLVVIRGENGAYVVVDGFSRLRALDSVGADHAEVLLLEGDEAAGLAQVYSTGRSGGWSAVEEALLVRALLDLGWSQEQVSRRMGRSVSWVSRRLGLLSKMPAIVLAEVREGNICAHGAERALVPLARANEEAATRLIQNLSGERVSSRGLMKLYEWWREGDPKVREWVVSHPKAVLQAWQERNGESPETCPALAGLEKCRSLLHSVGRKLKAEKQMPWVLEQQQRMTYLLDEVVALANQVRLRLEQEQPKEEKDVGHAEAPSCAGPESPGILPQAHRTRAEVGPTLGQKGTGGGHGCSPGAGGPLCSGASPGAGASRGVGLQRQAG